MPTVMDLLLPAACAGCRAPGAACCPECRRMFGAPRRVGRPMPVPVFALAPYRGPARQVVLAYKERGRRDLAPALGRILAAGIAALPDHLAAPVLVPAPSRRAASRVRGGSHVSAVAQRAADTLGSAAKNVQVARALQVDSGVADAVGLDAAARQANLAGHIRVKPSAMPAPGAQVVLVDDVVTTGATIKACVKALTSQNVRVVAAVALTAAGQI